ncbi:AAHS family benzoate transporter-like MFS transporter [Amycolatopsis thermoflava]|uniref:AAHS family benzoate transporter-like MFS transporter n=2 Tax=Amycolatopsis thermoflava TaxID=84480 RepID=A0A3N2H661_9PSEU|nr:AAHS family benzoate transporter-like MFS transporter [Amycolatopsis thermoflava]
MSSPVSPSPAEPARTPRSVLLLCLACMTLEGYDVVAYGAALPFLLADRSWQITVAQAGVLGTLTPVGMLAGAVAAGLLTDIVGRRRLILASVTVFSAAMLVCALAPGVPVFALGRILVGLGVGGVLPSIAALVYEYSPSRRRNLDTALAFAGVGTGGALAAVVAAVVVPAAGFRAEFLIGGLGALVVLPLAVRYLPESLVYLRATGRGDELRRWAARLRLDPGPAGPVEAAAAGAGTGRLAVLFSRRYAVTTVLFCLTTFASLLVLFGLYTWLPQLMRSAGHELGSALTFLVVLNVGTAAGPLLVGRLADRVGSQRATAGSFLLAVVGISVLSQPMPLVFRYVAVVLAGVGTVGTQILINVLIAGRYPVHVRATAIGVALSVGRLGGILGPLYGGMLLSAQLPTASLFYAFAAPALLGAVLVTLVPRARRADPRAASESAEPAGPVSTP